MSDLESPSGDLNADDIIFCTVCDENDVISAALNYCPQCRKRFCGSCTNLHGRIFKEHKLLGKPEVENWGHVEKGVTKTICKEHNGQEMDMYCKDRKMACCSECALLHHKSCDVLDGLPERCDDPTTDFASLTEDACRITPKLLQAKERREQTRERIVNQGKEVSKTIKTLRKEFDDLLERIESHTNHALETLLKATDDNLVGDVEHCDKLKAFLDTVRDLDAKDITTTGKSFAFMCLEHCQRILFEAEKLMNGNSRKKFELKFEADEKLKNVLSSADTLGHLYLIVASEDAVDGPNELSDMFVVKETTKYNIETTGDAETCGIRGVCGFPNGDIVITDCTNNHVKLLDDKFIVLDTAEIPAHPRDICCLGDDTVAVTVCDHKAKRQEIQKLKLQNRKIKHQTTISLEHDCYGLALHNDKLYVSSHTALYVYTLDGKLIQKLYEDTSEMFTIWRIAVSDDGEKIYIASYSTDQVVTLDKDGNVTAKMADEDLEGPSGICVAGNGTVFVCGENSNTVIQVDREGKKKLATLDKRTRNPETLWYNRAMKQLIVGQDHNKVKVLKLGK